MFETFEREYEVTMRSKYVTLSWLKPCPVLGRDKETVEISWSSIGGVSVEETERFVKQLNEAIEVANGIQEGKRSAGVAARPQ